MGKVEKELEFLFKGFTQEENMKFINDQLEYIKQIGEDIKNGVRVNDPELEAIAERKIKEFEDDRIRISLMSPRELEEEKRRSMREYFESALGRVLSEDEFKDIEARMKQAKEEGK